MRLINFLSAIAAPLTTVLHIFPIAAPLFSPFKWKSASFTHLWWKSIFTLSDSWHFASLTNCGAFHLFNIALGVLLTCKRILEGEVNLCFLMWVKSLTGVVICVSKGVIQLMNAGELLQNKEAAKWRVHRAVTTLVGNY